MDWRIVCLVLTLLLQTQGVEGQIKAYFNMAGISGDVEFRVIDSNRTRLILNLTPSTLQGYSWEIRQLPVITTESHKCEDSIIGDRLHNLTESLNVPNVGSNTEIDLDDVSLFEGPDAILGRTLFLVNGNSRACATIQGPEPLTYAIINGHTAGNVVIRQIGSRYAIFTDLFSTVSLDSATTTLNVYSGTVNADLPDIPQQVITVGERCSGVSSTNMVAEIKNIPVAGGGSSQRAMQIIETSGYDFSSGWVKLEVNGDTSCANLHDYKPKTVQAIFSRDGVQGEITFTQQNPYKPTTVNVNLQNLDNNGDGYHIHVYPLPYQYAEGTDLCGAPATGGHFTPFETSVGTTQDVKEIGDLSGKYGSLQNKSSIDETYTDLYAPLFGKYSIVGRSIVIHRPTGARWVCASIGYPGPVIVANTDFNGDVEGSITLIQEENKPWGDTSLFIRMSNSGEGSSETSGHKYHIHTSQVGDDYLSDTGRCSSTAGHWNPFDVAVGDSLIYSPTCQAHRQGCEVGDLNGKFLETLDMAASPDFNQYFYTDDIPLSGAYSVINRAITIHQAQSAAPRYVCADIKRKLLPVVKTDTRWDGPAPADVVTGSMIMSASGVTAVSTVEVDMEGLASQAGGYHIHTYPLNYLQPGDNVCGTTGGHYNPLGATVYDAGQSFDKYEIGDLSNKFGSMSGTSLYKIQETDTNLPLSGMNAAVGRSIVIHKSDGSRWKCADTVWDSDSMNGTLFEATAEFTGDIQGEIRFSQVVSAEGKSDVNIISKLWYSNESDTTGSINHNWHVHISTVANEDCSTTSGHYNPFNIDVGAAGYSTSCSSSSPRKCEYGDQSGKLGRLDIGIKNEPAIAVFNDDFLDFTGHFSIIGRSIVIHAENSGAPRVACADIVPVVPASQISSYYISTPEQAAFQDDMADLIATEVNADGLQSVYVKSGITRGNCTSVQVFFSGIDASQMASSFDPSSVPGYGSVDLLNCGAGIDAQDSPIMAYFNMSGVIGDIVFSEMDNTGNNTKATINIKVDNIWFNWEIREFPVLLSEADPCSEDKLGRRVVNLSPFKNIIDSRTTAGTEVELNGVSLLQGDNAILGRSVLLYNDNKRACATIQGSEILLHTSIEGHVAGKVEVRRVGTRYAIFSNLFNTKSLASSTTTLRIYRGSILPDEAAAQKQEVVLDDRCDIVSGASLVAEVKNVPIAGGADTSLHFSHVLATVARVDYSKIWAKVDIETGYSCGNFHIYERKEVQATFSVNGVTGFMRFSQDNPYTPTNVTVELTNLDNNGGGYHIHEYPLPYQFEAITDQCGSGSTGGHFNPFGVTGFNPSQNSQATQELYEIGDLSAKHGFLTSADDWSQNYTDMFIPLFGKNSVVGRSIVIHYPDGNRFICATIGYPGPVTVAQAEFNGEAFGTITFVQEENKPWSDTTVLVEVVSAQESESLQHNWHIHRDPVGDDYLPGSDARCSSTGPHWNPFAAPIADTNVYEPTCGAHRQGCEVGDLSAKYQEKINLASTRENPEKLFYSDILPLTGGYTIINRAITIHYPNGGAPRFVCGDIKKKLTPAVTTESIWWGPSEDDTVTGAIKIASDGLPKAVATLEVDLDGLAEMAGGYHIHMYPLNSRNPGDNVCGTTGGHYNPFGVTEWENDDSFDKYEIGDLSSKFGTLNDESTFKGQFFDTNLPLSGANSVVGRSVVIHQSADGSRWKCSNTVWDTEAMNATLVEAKADFVGAVTGYMKFSQMMTPEGESNVNIEVMLSHTDAAALGSVEHNWHVHESSVNYGDCKTAGGHYNPFEIDVSASSYQSQCDESTPRKCEMGDEAGKLGRIEIGANGEQSRYVFNDDYLSLNGKFPIIGRSIVIHAANEGGDRIACADIIPYGVSTFAVEYYIETPNDAFKDSMATNIENSLFMDDLNHVYVKDGDVKGSCTAVSVMFTGPDAEQLKNNFTRDFYDYATESYKVKDINACSSAMGNAAMLSGVTLLISIMAALLLH